MKTLANLKLNLKNYQVQPPSRRVRRMQLWVIALVALTMFLPCLFSRGASASDFHFHIKDDETGNNFFINALTGDYLLFKKANRSYLTGRGKLTISDCLLELRDSGMNAKRPDRNVYVTYNLCDGTAKAEGQIFATGEAFAVIRNQVTDDEKRNIDMVEKGEEPRPDIRFEPVCVQDDVQSQVQLSTLLAFANGQYRFTDRQKNISLSGEGSVVYNGCKVTVTDNGGDPKRPTHRTVIEYNQCTFEATAFIWIAETGKSYVVRDSDTRNSANCLF